MLSADYTGELGKSLPCPGHISAESTWSCFTCKPDELLKGKVLLSHFCIPGLQATYISVTS